MGCVVSAPVDGSTHARTLALDRDGGAGRRGTTSGPGTRAREIERDDGRGDGRARCKLVLLGASGCGKTSLSARFTRDAHAANVEATVGAAFASRTITVRRGRDGDDSTDGDGANANANALGEVKFEVWDTAGEERYASLAPLYYRGASAAMIVFDVTSRETLTRARYWANELAARADARCATTLVGNKIDAAAARETTSEEADALAREFAMTGGYVETSAKTGAGVREAFEILGRDALARARDAHDRARDVSPALAR
ncbi:Small GTPase superfamily, Rho type [Ostreococcus tauri]|uniref:Small GTPase superfamily, Rho type n=1 Tax=Ostreococcus tauri TaxID=70448 RepID=Q010X7_OSTTA|nr:Small GTPase superfamily, Rho type [Ostreococcus tauri]CAL55553.1 Small GTPase superfamily, Rho type [Ostreococcus tauri]|eukprot:XP_003081384.1 Small GTPase superfamily, Rho type [Ostreococcus tauri]